MKPIFYFLDIWFVGDENNRNLNNLFQKWFGPPSKVPISTRIILRNTIKRSRMFNQLLLTQNVQISIVFLSVKSIIMKIKEWHHVSLTSNISAKTWSNCTSVYNVILPCFTSNTQKTLTSVSFILRHGKLGLTSATR